MKNRKLKYLSDQELYTLIGNADKATSSEAFEEVYSRYSTKVYTYCRKVFANESISDDIYQETFIRFFESAKKERLMTNVYGFLIKIARNLCLNEKSKRKNDRISLEDLHLPYFDKSYDQIQLNEILETAMDALPEKYREVLIMKEYLDLSYAEIAEALEVTMPIIRIRIYRAKNKLRELLNPYLEELSVPSKKILKITNND